MLPFLDLDSVKVYIWGVIFYGNKMKKVEGKQLLIYNISFVEVTKVLSQYVTKGILSQTSHKSATY